MKKICIALAFILLLGLVGCGGSPSSAATPAADSVISEPVESISAASESDSAEEAYEVTYASTQLFTNSIGTVWLQTIVEVTNTGGVDLYLSSGAYDLEDAAGSLVASRTMVSCFPEVIGPGEKAYYYEETTLDDVDVDTELTVLPRPSVAAAKVPNTRFAVSDFELKADDLFGLKMLGRVENTGEEESTMTYIACVMYDAEGTPIGLIFTILTEALSAGDKIGFEQGAMSLPDDVTIDTIASHEIFAYPMQMQF